jgi:hypothetical protein
VPRRGRATLARPPAEQRPRLAACEPLDPRVRGYRRTGELHARESELHAPAALPEGARDRDLPRHAALARSWSPDVCRRPTPRQVRQAPVLSRRLGPRRPHGADAARTRTASERALPPDREEDRRRRDSREVRRPMRSCGTSWRRARRARA